jgi:AcrR family transcriptional regulator
LGKSKKTLSVARKVPSGQRQRLAPEDRRQRMLKVGLSLFGARLYADVSITEICSAAGVSTPLLQHYFGSKSSFFVAVVHEAMEELERLTRPADSPRNFSRLDQYLRAFFTFMRDHPMGAAVMRQDAQANPEIAALTNRYRDRTHDLVVEALDVSILSDRVSAAIRCWIGLNETIVIQLLARPSLSVDWAARFSSASLEQLIKAAQQ